MMDSTVWKESKETRLVWMTLLMMADRDGIVSASVPGLADRARVSLEECVTALKVLSGPDKWSRSKNNEGRRVVEIEGGWELLNYLKYRAKSSPDEARDKARIRQAKYRANNPRGKQVKKTPQETAASLSGRTFNSPQELISELNRLNGWKDDDFCDDPDGELPPEERIERVNEKIARQELIEAEVRKQFNPLRDPSVESPGNNGPP